MAIPLHPVGRLLSRYLSSQGARSAGLQLRDYQIEAAKRIFGAISSGSNAILNLPTGTGKTLISNLVSRAILEHKPRSRVLVVVPRRVLVTQHLVYSQWMAEVEAYSLNEQNVRRTIPTSAHLSACSILFTTPDLFANQVKSGLVDPAILRSFRLVVVDEFDEFLLPEFTDNGCDCRFDIAFQKLLDVLKKPAFILMSATSPVLSDGTPGGSLEALAASEKVRQYFDPILISPPQKNYKRFVPVTKLKLHAIGDTRAEELDAAVRDEISMLLQVLEEVHTGEVDRGWVMSRLDGLAEGRVRTIRLGNGRTIKLDPRLSKLFSRVRQFHYLRSFVYEDMCRGLSAEFRELTSVRDPVSGERVEFIRRMRLRGLHQGFEHHPQLGSKAKAVRNLIRGNSAVVVMFRYVRLLEAIAAELKATGVNPVTLHGSMDDRARARALTEFKRKGSTVLLMTRDTGKRGLDLPEADAAVFYSPKASESSTFQEASRIRSTTANVKTCHVLCYSGTDERDKLRRLVAQILQRRDRDYRILDEAGLS